MLKIEEMESKKLKTFRNYSSRSARVQSSLQSEQAEPEQKRKCLRGN